MLWQLFPEIKLHSTVGVALSNPQNHPLQYPTTRLQGQPFLHLQALPIRTVASGGDHYSRYRYPTRYFDCGRDEGVGLKVAVFQLEAQTLGSMQLLQKGFTAALRLQLQTCSLLQQRLQTVRQRSSQIPLPQ